MGESGKLTFVENESPLDPFPVSWRDTCSDQVHRLPPAGGSQRAKAGTCAIWLRPPLDGGSDAASIGNRRGQLLSFGTGFSSSRGSAQRRTGWASRVAQPGVSGHAT